MKKSEMKAINNELCQSVYNAEEAIQRVRELLSNLAVDEDGCVIPRDKEQLIELFNKALDGEQ